MKDLVTVATNENTHVHFPDTTGVRATLCGLDGDDTHKFSTQTVIPTEPKAKVNCPQCISIWVTCQSFSRDTISWSDYNTR